MSVQVGAWPHDRLRRGTCDTARRLGGRLTGSNSVDAASYASRQAAFREELEDYRYGAAIRST